MKFYESFVLRKDLESEIAQKFKMNFNLKKVKNF